MTLRYFHERHGRYEYRRYIPPKIRYLFGSRTEIVHSFGTRDASLAAGLYPNVHRKYDAMLRAAKADPSSFRTEDFKELASDIGIKAFPEDLDTIPVLELVGITALNLAAVSKLPKSEMKKGAFAAALSSRVTLNDIYIRYLFLTRDKDLKRSHRERDKARKPIERAIKECIETIGDCDVRKLRKADVYIFRDKLISDVEAGRITASTAMKKIMHLRKIISPVFRVDYPDLANPFEVEDIEDNAIGHRSPFSEIDTENVVRQLEASDLNDQLKAIIIVSMFTGAGCKEIALLTSDDIVLTHAFPHIKIGTNELRVKVKGGGDRHRKVPLYGSAIEVMQKFPDGFDRYARDGGGEAVSAAANKFLKRITGKTFYSFRHRLADLLRNSGCEDQMRNAIFGHKQNEMPNHYGDGYILEIMYNALEKAHELGKKQLMESQKSNA